jgi:transposase
VDPRPPGAGGARAGAEPDRALGGDDPAGPAAAGRGLEAGQALADQPRPRLRAKKRRRDRLIRLARGRPGWAFGFADEVWFSRLAQPALHAWASGEPLRLGLHAADRDDPEPKALACYGLWLPEGERMLLRFVAGRPVSGVTRAFLAWVAGRLAAAGVRVLGLVWDNAPWHVSREVRAWIRAHNRRVKAAGTGCRLLVCRLPSKSPWLNPIEPKWMHGKRAVAEPARKLTGQELRQRLCDHYRCPLVEPLAQQAA